VAVGLAQHRVGITLPARALGAEADLAGLTLHITTWVYDGGYRALAPQPGGHTVGGGDAGGAKVMDAMAITLP
jgi:hypothetical protein